MVLIYRASAHPYRADHLVVTHQWDAAGEDDDPAAVCGVDAEKRLARLGHLADLSCGEAPPGRGEGLVYGDVDARHPGPIHPLEGHKVPSSVHHGYVHRLAHLLRLVHSGRDDSLSFFECDHRIVTSPLTNPSSTTCKFRRSIIDHHAVSLLCLLYRTLGVMYCSRQRDGTLVRPQAVIGVKQVSACSGLATRFSIIRNFSQRMMYLAHVCVSRISYALLVG